MTLGLTQPVTELSTGNFPGDEGRRARKADVTAISKKIVWKMWEPRRHTTLRASTACYRDSFTLPLNNREEVEDKEETTKKNCRYQLFLLFRHFQS
jgi:hypothetical protein